ncbi:hypothetical protein G7Y89_g7725 [Cudoniella acicularis]|uniref:Ankyrin repeat domain-containing protein n=1 Tax=Cudoniella acicularis TaxID=354080 RepID=A0A8H4W1A2_9HELO|nr:hypothetical protein G7Y89_g7725 [Cudoniella acicularis]
MLYHNRCPICRESNLNGNGGFWVGLLNESGDRLLFDFEKEIDHKLYLKYWANPELERKVSFLGLMAHMAVEDAELFLKGEDLLAKGKKLDPNVCYEGSRKNAMHLAALMDNVEDVKLLLKYGADAEFMDEDGKTALDMAKEQDAKRVIALLSEKQNRSG